MIERIKIRKEEFGWIACNINSCETFIIDEETAEIIKLIKDSVQREQIIKTISNKFNVKEEEVNNIIDELKLKGWLDNEL
ncbi:hypothetical protein H8D36_03915 [archaeon]|nr:hypothetical protein [archaeon]MBL7057576.1 hypothetical protein [Candidatus Woesearchaeota archaeon]